jgi:hypothetical protein
MNYMTFSFITPFATDLHRLKLNGWPKRLLPMTTLRKPSNIGCRFSSGAFLLNNLSAPVCPTDLKSAAWRCRHEETGKCPVTRLPNSGWKSRFSILGIQVQMTMVVSDRRRLQEHVQNFFRQRGGFGLNGVATPPHLKINKIYTAVQ